jgi:ATP-dependent Clp protease ATP-binding subunit ClpC
LQLTPEAKLLLAKKGYDPTLGARPLRRAIQRMVEDPMSEKILWKEFSAGETIIVDAAKNDSGDEEITFRSVPGLAPPEPEPVTSGPTE